MTTTITVLDNFFGPATPFNEGVELPKRAKIDFVGSGVEVTDDPNEKKTVVTITGGGGGSTPTGTGFRHVTGGTEDGAAAAVNLGTADVTSILPVAKGGTGLDASTATTVGNVLRVSSAGVLVWAAVNLAGGAGHVTGVLPTANQAAQTMAGDVTGTTAASTVVALTGTAGKTKIRAASPTLSWEETVSTLAALGIDQRTTDGPTATLYIGGQAAYASATGTNRNGGSVVINTGAKASGGASGAVDLQVDGVSRWIVGETIGIASVPIYWNETASAFLSKLARTSDAATGTLTVSGQNAYGSATGTNQRGGGIDITAGNNKSGYNTDSGDVRLGSHDGTANYWFFDYDANVALHVDPTIRFGVRADTYAASGGRLQFSSVNASITGTTATSANLVKALAITNNGATSYIDIGGITSSGANANTAAVRLFGGSSAVGLTIESARVLSANPIAVGSDPATVGDIRLTGDTAKMVTRYGGSNVDLVGFISGSGNFVGSNGFSLFLQTGGTVTVNVAGTGRVYFGNEYVAVGASAATTGALRMANNAYLYGKRTDAANVRLIGVRSDDILCIGDPGYGPYVFAPNGGMVFDINNNSHQTLYRDSGWQFHAGAASHGGGARVIGISNCTTAPTSNPSGGGILFVESGELRWRGSGGTITTLAPA